MLVVLINGSNQSGKDKFVTFFGKYIGEKILNISTVEILKSISKKYLGWDGKKTEEARLFLVNMKKAWVEFNNGPFNYVVKKIERKNVEYNFVHCREPEEIQKFKDYYGDNLISVLLVKDSREVANNSSDQNVRNYDYDFIIDNNGSVYDLEQNVIKFIKDDLRLPVVYPTSPVIIDNKVIKKKSKKKKGS